MPHGHSPATDEFARTKSSKACNWADVGFNGKFFHTSMSQNIYSIYLHSYIFLAPHIYHKDLYIAWVYPRNSGCLAQGPGFDLTQFLPRFIADCLNFSVIKHGWYFQFFHLVHPANQFSFFFNIYFIFDLYLCLFNCFTGEMASAYLPVWVKLQPYLPIRSPGGAESGQSFVSG